MDRGQRLQIIQRIARTLSAGGWNPDIDLTLRTFELPTWDGNEGPYEYVCSALADATPSVLSELHAHLHPDDAATPDHGDGVAVWRGEGFRLFMSHTTPHKSFVTSVADVLEGWGFRTFVAHQDIAPTTEWQTAIVSALNSCDALCALLTDDFRTSVWCDQEVGFALGRAKVVVPLKVGADPHGFIGAVQALPIRLSPPRPHESASAIVVALARNEVTSDAMTDPVIRWFGTSPSFDSTRARFPAVAALPKEAWTEARVAYVSKQLVENYQLSKAVLDHGGGPVVSAIESRWKELGVRPAPAANDRSSVPRG